MRHATPAAVAALILGAAMQPVFAQSTVVPQHPGDPGYEALLDAATQPVRSAFGASVRVDVERLDRLGRWAFLQGTLRGADGGPPDYAGTTYAERAEQGGMSDVYVALLQAPAEIAVDPASIPSDAAPMEATGGSDRNAATTSGPIDDTDHATSDAAAADTGDRTTATPAWTLVDHAIGPSDVAWISWPARHAAPRQLFGF